MSICSADLLMDIIWGSAGIPCQNGSNSCLGSMRNEPMHKEFAAVTSCLSYAPYSRVSLSCSQPRPLYRGRVQTNSQGHAVHQLHSLVQTTEVDQGSCPCSQGRGTAPSQRSSTQTLHHRLHPPPATTQNVKGLTDIFCIRTKIYLL